MVISESKEHAVSILKVEVVIPGASTLYPKEGGSRFLWNIVNLPSVCMVSHSRRPQSYALSVETQFSSLLHVDANAKMDSCVQKQNIYTHTCMCHTHTHFFVLHVICSGHHMHIKCYVQLYYCVTNTGWLFQELSQLKIQQLLNSFFRLNCLLLYQWWTFSLKLW